MSLRIANGSSPLKVGTRWSIDGTVRGGRSRTAAAIAEVCSGVVPQHPPTTFTRPASANSRSKPLVTSGVSSYPPNAFGSPAFG